MALAAAEAAVEPAAGVGVAVVAVDSDHIRRVVAAVEDRVDRVEARQTTVAVVAAAARVFPVPEGPPAEEVVPAKFYKKMTSIE